jgi:hypothetical protein
MATSLRRQQRQYGRSVSVLLLVIWKLEKLACTSPKSLGGLAIPGDCGKGLEWGVLSCVRLSAIQMSLRQEHSYAGHPVWETLDPCLHPVLSSS